MRALLGQAALLVLLTGCASPYEGSLDDVRFSLELPAGSRVAREEAFPEMQYRRWEPASGDGFVVVVELHRRDPEPCREPNPTTGGGAEVVDGARRPTSFSASHCLGDGARHLRCACWHTRGHLEPSEVDAARAVCESLRVVR